jgi:hypothetical protein
MIRDEQWPVARLIPISSASGVEAQERRAASALLAVMHAVPEFARTLLKPLGAPTGRVETFIEIPFKTSGGQAVRPDGLIRASRGGKTWQALVETKTGSGQLTQVQIDMYLDLARELEFDAVLSISNQYVSSSTEYPVEVDKRKLKKVSLHHWSWIDILTEAVVQQEHRGVSDPDQAYILGELIRYLSDPRSGAASFEGMGPHWTAVRDGAREQTLRRGDPSVAAVASRWDDLIRFLGLQLTMELGQDVRQSLSPSERTPGTRHAALVAAASGQGRLYAELRVPNAAGPLEILVDLRSRQVTITTRVAAPELGTSKGRVSWLLRQLEAGPEGLKVEARVSRTSSTLAVNLRQLRESPHLLYPERPREIRQFVLTATRNMGLKRDSGRGSFVESIMQATESFYREVLQNLRPWRATPPKLRQVAETSPAQATSDLLGVPEDAIDEEELEPAPEYATQEEDLVQEDGGEDGISSGMET